jgi:hypothetical protein
VPIRALIRARTSDHQFEKNKVKMLESALTGKEAKEKKWKDSKDDLNDTDLLKFMISFGNEAASQHPNGNATMSS